MVLLVSLLLFTHLCLCHSQEFLGDDNDCDDKGNCSDVTSCISQYSQLELYILNNKDILRTLTETFFKTGDGASQFVKITYNFEVSNHDGRNSTEDDVANCTSHKATYMWSTSVLYLLGPRPLFWLTLFAVIVPEANGTVELPCLCADVLSNLLDRLTYLVCVLTILCSYSM